MGNKRSKSTIHKLVNKADGDNGKKLSDNITEDMEQKGKNSSRGHCLSSIEDTKNEIRKSTKCHV